MRANEFISNGDNGDEDDESGPMEATFTFRSKGKIYTGTVLLFPGETTDVEYHLNGKIYSKTEMSNVHDYDEFITNAKDIIAEIVQLQGDGYHFVEDNEEDQNLKENFADGKKPGRKGLAKRSGVDCKQSVTKLRSVAKNSTGEKRRMAHWCANMKSGRKKNETVNEKWSTKYKKSINCSNPKGFSQRAHCQGRKKKN